MRSAIAVFAAAALVTTACQDNNQPGGDVALEKSKLADIEAHVLTVLDEAGTPAQRIPVYGSPDTQARVTLVWHAADVDTSRLAAFAADGRNSGIRWHRATCNLTDSYVMAGTASVPASVVGVTAWPADVTLMFARRPPLKVADIAAPFVQLTVGVERGLPIRGSVPAVEPTDCPRGVAALLG